MRAPSPVALGTIACLAIGLGGVAPAALAQAPDIHAAGGAIHAQSDCFFKNARLLDDGTADAMTVALAVRAACEDENEQVITALANTMGVSVMPSEDKLRQEFLDAADATVLQLRAMDRSFGQTK